MAPADENECRQMLYTGFMHDGPAAVRYPRGRGPGVRPEPAMTALPIGVGEIRRTGQRVAILSFGGLLDQALAAGDALDATVANMRFVKPLDVTLARELAESHDLVVTLEDNAVMGGAGSGVNEALAALGLATPVLNLRLPDAFVEHGTREELLADCGLDAGGIVAAIQAHLAAGDCPNPRKRLIS